MAFRIEPSIDPEFENLIPPLSTEEFRQLEENILEVGECREPLVVWNRILLDGHNRWRIIQKHPGEIDYECREMVFDSRNEAMAWMIRNQLGRRNLPSYERARLALRLKEAIAAEAKANQSTHTEQGYQKSDKAVDTNKELAKVAGVSHDTIHKVDVIEQKAPEEVKAQLRRGEVSINKAYNAIRESERPATPPPPGSTSEREAMQFQEPEESRTPTYSLNNLVSELNGNADTFVSFVRSTLAVRSGIYADEESRTIVRNSIHQIANRLLAIEELLK